MHLKIMPSATESRDRSELFSLSLAIYLGQNTEAHAQCCWTSSHNTAGDPLKSN